MNIIVISILKWGEKPLKLPGRHFSTHLVLCLVGCSLLLYCSADGQGGKAWSGGKEGNHYMLFLC